jgi:hypothetical protein
MRVPQCVSVWWSVALASTIRLRSRRYLGFSIASRIEAEPVTRLADSCNVRFSSSAVAFDDTYMFTVRVILLVSFGCKRAKNAFNQE